MSKEIDNLLDNLIKEIGEQEGPETAPKPASEEAARRAEVIAKDVNQSYRRPPEPVKQSIPAPQLKKVVEPEPTSHFSGARSQDPAIRMHDRLDESTLPTPDAERRPTQIRNIGGKNKRSIPAPAEPPKRKIPHISIPDELPPDVPAAAPAQEKQETDPEREKLVKSRAEKIREQLKKRTLEETPIIPPPSEEEIDGMISDLEKPQKPAKEDGSIFSYLHQALGVEEEPEEPLSDAAPEDEEEEGGFARWFDEEPESDTEDFVADTSDEDYDDEYDEEEFEEDEVYDDEDEPRFRHLDDEDEIVESRPNRLLAFFRGLFRRHTAESDEHRIESGEMDDEYYEDDDPFAEDEYIEQDFAGEEEFEDEPMTEEPEASEEEPEEESEEPAAEEPEEEPAEEETEEEAEEPAAEETEEESFEEDEPEEEFQRTEKKHSRFFSEAFDESAEELAEMKAEPDPRPAQDADIKNRFLGRNSYFVAGIIVLLLALVGLVTFITAVAKAAGGFFSGGSLKNQLEQALYPVAVVDVPSFNEPAELTAEGALSAAIVDILMHDDLSGYTETFDMISVPAEDVLERGRQMFGVDVQTQLDTLHAAGESFVYDAQSNCFNVPAEPMIFSYSPEVKKIQRTGDTYEVTVVYRGDVADWQKNSRNFTSGSSKTMQATIEKKSNGYRIVRLVPAN
ncbi:MAG: hypothetical protein IJ906_12070 [Oscillospiraceae bacterium]|nr:hypothetical protein [Oscillospiraceae bacterium]